jgi:hypothetical protein
MGISGKIAKSVKIVGHFTNDRPEGRFASMSTAPVVTTTEERRPMTPEASNLLGWWWLAIALTIVLITAMWPSIFPENSGMMPIYFAIMVCGALVAVGIWASIGFWRASPSSAQIMRLTAMIGIGVGIAGVAYFLYSVAFATPVKTGPGSAVAVGFFGPEGSFLTSILWTLLVILPFIFGLLVIFGLMSDGIEEWFNPQPEEMVTRKQPRLQVDPSTAAIMAGGAAASMEVAEESMTDIVDRARATAAHEAAGEDVSVEVVGSAHDDLSVEVIGGATEQGTVDELAALEKALSEDLKGKPASHHSSHDEPLSVDDDLKI